MWIDAHTHLEMLKEETDETLTLARKAGVTHCITVGCHPNDFQKVYDISKSRYPNVAATLGVHPHEAKLWSDEIQTEITSKSSEPFVVGLGEMGFDFHYNHSEPTKQAEVFEIQMEMAQKLKLPVQIHSRNADSETASMLNKFKTKTSGMLHCFTSSLDLAKAALDIGFYISFSGVVTFKNADDLRATLKFVPLDRILIETDAPFLAPVPMRGKPNTPAFVSHTAAKVAEIKQVSLAELSTQLFQNTKSLFPKWNL